MTTLYHDKWHACMHAKVVTGVAANVLQQDKDSNRLEIGPGLCRDTPANARKTCYACKQVWQQMRISIQSRLCPDWLYVHRHV